MRRASPAAFLIFAGLLTCIANCSRQAPAPEQPALPADSSAPSTPAADASLPLVIFLGDSLTAGLGLDVDQAYPAVLAADLAKRGLAIRLVNAGVSGDTTAGGLARLDWLLHQRPDILVVGLGANDGLRGLDLSASEDNLRQIVATTQAAHVRVLLLGMLIPPSYGPDYVTRFAAIYPRLARQAAVPLVPFLLAGVATHPDLNQADGIHPTAEGQRLVAANVMPYLEPLVRASIAERSAGAR